MGNKRNKNNKILKCKAHKKMLQNHAVDMRRKKKEHLAKNLHAAGPSGLHSHNSTQQEESQLLTLDSIVTSEMDGDEYNMSREHTETHSESMEPRENSSTPRKEETGENIALIIEEEKENEYLPISGRRIIDINYLMVQLQEKAHHNNLFDCKVSSFKLLGEKRSGLKSTFKFKCGVCREVVLIDSEDSSNKEHVGINVAATTGVVAAGIGFSQFEEILSAMNVPVFSRRYFTRIQDIVYKNWENTAMESMEAAANKEKDAAIADGRVKNGIPLIDVCVDGAWGLRSYGNNYRSMSGTAAIIGKLFGEVLYIGVKNKYCMICARAKKQDTTPKEHTCFKNYEGPSSAMEADIIAEGFKSSLEMYGIIYARMVGDGDSSTYNKVIVESHKELRCPECRVLVEVKVEELPPNVLLMRILEGMKNAPRKPVAGQRARTGHSQAQQTPSRDNKHLPPHARAIHDYMSKEIGDLSFKKGEIILLQKKLDLFWYQGECSGRTGMFPITYVQVIIPLQVPTALCKALYDFRMSAPDEEGCLAFDKGAIITVHRRVDENWAEGRLEQKVGIFPIAFVEVNQAARMLMNKTPLNRPVPPLPDHPKAGHSDHRHLTTQNLQRYQPMSTSMPTTQSNYQNMPTMSLSHPNYQPMDQILPVSQVTSQGVMTTSIAPATMLQRNIVDTKHSVDLIHFAMGKNAVQFLPRLSESWERNRGVKWEYNSTTPVHKVDTTNQNVRTEPVNFTNSSDSSSSVNTPSAGSTTTPNTSSNTSTCESAEPSLPSSPDNNTERNATIVNSNTTQIPTEEPNEEVNTSMGVLSLNESSTATNTSLNVSLPPAESPKLNAVASSGTAQNQEEVAESTSNNEPSRLELPSSSKGRSSGPVSLLNFGLGLQAVLSPSHDATYLPRHREHREKRHSLTPSTHLQNHTNQNRHSAEILATSLLDQSVDSGLWSAGGRRRRERSAERGSSSGPHIFVALYPYKPQKPDELELKKGGVYMVSERCRDGWFKGWCARSQRHGVFPGNYVAPRATQVGLRTNRDKTVAVSSPVAKPSQAPSAQPPPDAPPRGQSPVNTNAGPLHNLWTSQQSQSQQSTPRIDKSKDKSKAEKSSISTGVSLMKRLAAMKKCKSPPPQGYSMDNPVFEDGPGTSLMLNLAHNSVHVRSGSCPSQLLRALPAPAPVAASDRRHKDRHHDHVPHRSNDNPWQSQHRKSQSLDVTAARRDRHHSQAVKERYRCIVPYPPNSEYELELKVDDIVIVHKKRGDGWYKGTLQRTGRTGLFPASFVQGAPYD